MQFLELLSLLNPFTDPDGTTKPALNCPKKNLESTTRLVGLQVN
jgi:hypothetical protein